MAKKPGVTTIATGYYSRAALNANFEALNNAFDNTVSRDGSTPNTMSADLDMNSNDITNANVIGANSLVVNGKLIAVSNDPVFDGTVTAFGASLIADADATEGRATLGLGTASTAAATDFVNTTGVTSGNVTFAENSKAIFGAGSDLQIYHDGSNSRISEVGAGGLVVQARDAITFEDGTSGDNYLYMQRNSKVELYHAGAAKLTTTSTGVDVTGTVNATSYTGDGSNLTGIAPALEIIAYARVSNATTNPLTVDFSTGFSSMARTSTGNYTFTFSSARSSVDYMVFCQCASGTVSRTQAVNTQSTTDFNVDTRVISSGGTTDEDFNVIVYALPS